MNQTNQVSVFAANGIDDVFFAFTSRAGVDFKSELASFMAGYEQLMAENNCSEESEVFVRFHLSDVATQAPILQAVAGNRNSFFSYVGQPPTHGARIAVEAYHIRGLYPLNKQVVDENGAHELDVRLSNYELFIHCRRHLRPGTSYEQTVEECRMLNQALLARNGTFMNNCLRTWFYGRDIDNNYRGIVDARRKYFRTIGMDETTHYVASTGIEGQDRVPHRLVSVDTLCVFGIQPEQLEFMHARDHMPPTYTYNVTFERGTRVIYGDRSHYYISGTASIDADGEVMHPGDVRWQTHRMVANVEALLVNHGGSLNDLQMASVYLRDNADADAVAKELLKLLPDSCPRIIVTAPVCRPGWLIEMEGVAVNSQGDNAFKKFA